MSYKEMKMNEEIKIRKLTEEEGGGYLAEYTHLKGVWQMVRPK